MTRILLALIAGLLAATHLAAADSAKLNVLLIAVDDLRDTLGCYTEWSDGQRELYDHASDSEETRNVVAANPEVARVLREQLNAARK